MATASKQAPADARLRRSAAERREDLLAAASREFALRGLYGTPTTAIAARAGISHPYLFRLFPSKKAIFIACMQRTHEQICDVFRAAGAPHHGDAQAALDAMGTAYNLLLDERSDLLRLQIHAQAACQEPEVADTVRDGFRSVVNTVSEVSGADEQSVREFMATGMLLNALGAMSVRQRDSSWMDALRQP